VVEVEVERERYLYRHKGLFFDIADVGCHADADAAVLRASVLLFMAYKIFSATKSSFMSIPILYDVDCYCPSPPKQLGETVAGVASLLSLFVVLRWLSSFDVGL